MQKIWENNGTEEIGLVTPTPGLTRQANPQQMSIVYGLITN